MRRNQRHLSAAALERLLEGDVSDASPLSRTLAAARAPGAPHEVAGLEAARSAFVLSSLAPSRSRATLRPATATSAAGRLVALKILAAVSGSSLIGGAAYAAASGGLITDSTQHHRSPAHHGTAPAGSQPGGFVVPPGDGRATASAAISTRPHATPSGAVRGPGDHPASGSHPSQAGTPARSTPQATKSSNPQATSHGNPHTTPPGQTRTHEPKAAAPRG
jgi:hypothetical protein